MFGKRKEDHKHRYDVPEDEARPESDDPEFAAALRELGRNRHALQPADVREPDAPDQTDESPAQDDPQKSAVSPAPSGRARAGVPTAADLAEPEPEPELDSESAGSRWSSRGGMATHSAPRRESSKDAEQEAALRRSREEVLSLRAELKRVRAGTQAAGGQAAAPGSGELEQELRKSRGRIDELTAEVERLQSSDTDGRLKELRSKVSALTAELERTRSEAAAAGVALERFEREAKDQEKTVATAEERADRLAAEVEKLRAEATTGPAQLERLRRDAEREKSLRTALEQTQAFQAQAEAAVADNRRLAGDLLANLQSQEGLIAALTGLQAEVTEQRAWFEAQLASLREMESQQASVVDRLQAAIRDRDLELEQLRRQLLEAEAKRAEEAAAFVAALEGQ